MVAPLLVEDSLGFRLRRRLHTQGSEQVRVVQVKGCLHGFDGGVHAFLLDIVVAGPLRWHGVGTRLVEVAACEVAAAGCKWLHVDFEDYLGPFYFDRCGFRPTNVGLIRLGGGRAPVR